VIKKLNRSAPPVVSLWRRSKDAEKEEGGRRRRVKAKEGANEKKEYRGREKAYQGTMSITRGFSFTRGFAVGISPRTVS
jgi:hypothetical protein